MNSPSQVISRITDWMVDLREKRVPQLFVATCGVFAVSVGFLFLLIPRRFDQAPALQFLINLVPPLFWGMAFFALGFILATCAVVNYTKAVAPSIVLGLVCFLFAILSLVEVFNGPATGLVVVGFGMFGWVCLLTSVLSIAPTLQQELHHE